MIPLGQPIFAAPHLQPDFYVIHDWHNARESAEPEWRKVYFIGGRWYAHPNVLQTLDNQPRERE